MTHPVRSMQENDEPEGPWRKILLSGGAILGAAAAYNAFARKGVDKLTNLIGGEEGGFEWRDRRVAFTKRGEGPADSSRPRHSRGRRGRTNGVTTSTRSSRTNTVYTIDLLGFGQSDRPAIRYSARLYISLISDFVSRVIDAPTVLVASSLSGAYAIVLAARDPAPLSRRRADCAVGTGATQRASRYWWRSRQARGRHADRRHRDVQRPGIATESSPLSQERLLQRLARHTRAGRDLLRDFASARCSPRAGAFLSGHLNIDVRHALRRLSQPALLVWGEQGSIAPVEEFRGFRELKRDLEISVLSPAGDLPHDERAEDFNVILSTWLNRLSLSSAPTLATLPGTPADLPPTQQLL